jgi:hypothetical protein
MKKGRCSTWNIAQAKKAQMQMFHVEHYKNHKAEKQMFHVEHSASRKSRKTDVPRGTLRKP